MSFTILQQPQEWQPAYNENVWLVLSSDVNTYFQFKYICDVYASDGLTRIARLKAPARPDTTNGAAYFDVHRIVENYVTDDIAIGTSNTTPNSTYKYGVKFGEEYATTSGGTAAVIPTSGFTPMQSGSVFNAAMRFQDFFNFDFTEFAVNTSGTTGGKWLTNQPTSASVRSTERAWLHYFSTSGDTSTPECRYSFYNGLGALISYSDYGLPASKGKAHAGPLNIAATVGGGFPATTAYYTMVILDYASNPIASTLRTFVVNDKCTRFDKNRIHFLNALGGYDSFTFDMISEKSATIARKKFQTKSGAANAAGTSYGYDFTKRENTSYNTVENQSYRFESDWLSEAQMTWMSEMATSPKLFLDDGTTNDDALLPLNVEVESFVFKKKQNEQLFQLSFNASLTIPNQRQRY